jgi:Domain of unknown function (DUF4832)/Domain of unknown function (DUF4874)
MSKSQLWMTILLGAIGCLGIGVYLKQELASKSELNSASQATATATVTQNVDSDTALNDRHDRILADRDLSPHLQSNPEQIELTVASKPAMVGGKIVHYQSSDRIISNPERGFFWQKYTIEGDRVSVEELRKIRQQDHVTVIRGVYDIKQYRDRPLPQSVLTQFDRDCDIYRQAGSKVMPLFYYTKEFKTPQESDARLEIISQHINQLKPLIEKNQDVIAAWYAGFIGPYGEWWGSEHMSTDSKSINQNSRKLLTQMLTAVPKNRTILLRRLTYKRQFLGDSKPLSLAEAFKGTSKSRIGHYNDGLVANPSEGQALSVDPTERQIEESYLNLDNRFVPAAAETEYLDQGESSHCPRSVKIVRSRRYSLIHKQFNLNVLNQWRQEGCFDEIEKKIGYRFVAIQSEMPQSISRSLKIPLRLTLKNEGWAAPFNRRSTEIVFTNRQSGKTYKSDVSSQADPRQWLPEKGQFTIDLQIPHKLTPGTYDVSLNLPDPMPKLKNRADYSIQLANAQIWNPASGFNSLARTISIR